jgi:coproporphyrinogen III oxidase-like Fe-S oxidoreductase
MACGSGARSVSVDIIYGTPGQTPGGLSREIRMLCELGPDHVSAYELTIAPDTPLGRRAAGLDPALPDQDAMVDLWLEAGRALTRAGLERYEVSSYARPGQESVHNRHYWLGGSYVGLGAGAHGFEKDGDLMIRLVNSGDAEKYMNGEPAQREVIQPLDHARELVMLGLRTVEGVDIERVSRDLGPDLVKQWRHIAEDIVNQGHARRVGNRIVPTSSGMLLADTLAGRFF